MEEKVKRGRSYDWIPLWIDKWLMGSTRFELEPGERSVFLDLLVLGAKDDGFIRANTEMGYPREYLARILNVSAELLESSILKCIEHGKIKDLGNGIFFIKNWENYSLSGRHKRRVMSENMDIASESSDARLCLMSKSSSSSPSEDKEEDKILLEFDSFWDAYPVKVSKKDSLNAFRALRKTVSLEDIIKAFNGYMDFLKDKRIKENFEQSPMYPATFLRLERWKEFIDFKYKPSL
jgi:hypothetical protein